MNTLLNKLFAGGTFFFLLLVMCVPLGAQEISNQATIYDLAHLERYSKVEPDFNDTVDSLVCGSESRGRVTIIGLPRIRVCASDEQDARRQYQAALVRVARSFGNTCIDNNECFPANCMMSFARYRGKDRVPPYDPVSGKWIFEAPSQNRMTIYFDCPCVLGQIEQLDSGGPRLGTSSPAPVWSPNPVRDQVQLRLDVERAVGQLEVRLYDIQGRMVYRDNWGSRDRGAQWETLDLGGIPEGLYLASILADAHLLHTSQLLIQR